jgi:hypothetical protein
MSTTKITPTIGPAIINQSHFEAFPTEADPNSIRTTCAGLPAISSGAINWL